MREIGRILQLQVQRSSLKVGQRPHAHYDPAPLLVVDSLLISPDGVVGLTADGGKLIDVHNARHPASKNRGENGISVGFTSHYQAMRARCGPHLVDGCAGENILVEAGRSFALDDLGSAVAIQSSATGRIVYLTDLQVAAPCVEFSHFAAGQAANLEAEQLQAMLRFLDGGRRGFYAALADQQQAVVQAGDRVFVADMIGGA